MIQPTSATPTSASSPSGTPRPRAGCGSSRWRRSAAARSRSSSGRASSGVAVAIGHTAADAAAIRRAVDAGASISTHLGNGSHPQLPRLRNYLWEQLACDDLTAGLIPDGFHLPEAVMRVFARAKGLERIFLVSDVGSCAGLPPGRYRWDRIEVEVCADGH